MTYRYMHEIEMKYQQGKTVNLNNTMASDQPLKKISQLLLLSVSVFSFIFSYSLWCSSLVYSFKVYFTTYPVQLVTHALNKNCIFLLCNGLLVFLAKTSGLVHSRAGFDLNDLLRKKIGDGLQTLSLDHEKESSSVETILENKPTAMEDRGQSENCGGEGKEEDRKVYEESKSEPEEEGEILNFNAEQDYKKEEEILDLVAFEERDYKEEEEDDDAKCESTEELNKKFEDFIRRMKKEITTTD